MKFNILTIIILFCFFNCNDDSVEVTERSPEIVVPPNITLQYGDDISPDVIGYATTIETCDNLNISFTDTISESNESFKTIVRTWGTTDDCGNSLIGSQIITIENSETGVKLVTKVTERAPNGDIREVTEYQYFCGNLVKLSIVNNTEQIEKIFEYDGEKISQITWTNNGVLGLADFFYNQDDLEYFEEFDNENNLILRKDFVYNQQGKVGLVQFIGSDYQIYFENIQYDSFSNMTSIGRIVYQDLYTGFDEKNNPFLNQNKYVKLYMIFNLEINGYNMNNAINLRRYNSWLNEYLFYEIIYDNENYPSKITLIDVSAEEPGGNPINEIRNIYDFEY